MVTFDKVLLVFSDYLTVDTEVEVVKSKYGYIVLYWEDKHQELCYAKTCATPNSLFDELLSAYEFYRTFSLTNGDRKLTAPERGEIGEEITQFRIRLENLL